MNCKAIAASTLLAVVTLGAPGDAAAQTVCAFRGTVDALGERPSPLDSVLIDLGGAEPAKLCYGRPSARGRQIVGEQDPYGAPWRLGANEPTTLHLPFHATVGGVAVEPGSYSIYAIPGADTWTIVINGNTARWGIPINADVRAYDIGSFTVDARRLSEHVETLEFDFMPAGASGVLRYRWEQTELSITVRRR